MLARLLSLVLLAAVGLPTIAPALALAQDADAALPACCRRHGQHRCAMTADRIAQSRQDSQPQIGALCPCYPRHEVAPVTGAHLLALHAPQRAAAFSSARSPAARAETHRRISLERCHYKRGPPAASLQRI